ncbi:hypothetical protein D915_007662 [Fasciola hepatica]|uniref:LEM domain-containing protein n=1 Tax=Fasciola hepatica TaxID=6192 RepID=A0A4E0RKQ0_FASHE|nr:hypothetical protein D915_007662 [Fasciola hepatica]
MELLVRLEKLSDDEIRSELKGFGYNSPPIQGRFCERSWPNLLTVSCFLISTISIQHLSVSKNEPQDEEYVTVEDDSLETHTVRQRADASRPSTNFISEKAVVGDKRNSSIWMIVFPICFFSLVSLCAYIFLFS